METFAKVSDISLSVKTSFSFKKNIPAMTQTHFRFAKIRDLNVNTNISNQILPKPDYLSGYWVS